MPRWQSTSALVRFAASLTLHEPRRHGGPETNVVIRDHRKLKYAILFAPDSATHSRLPSRRGGCRSLPAVRPVAPALGVGSGNSVITPSGVTRPTCEPFVYQTLRSGPTAILIGDPV